MIIRDDTKSIASYQTIVIASSSIRSESVSRIRLREPMTIFRFERVEPLSARHSGKIPGLLLLPRFKHHCSESRTPLATRLSGGAVAS
jgi:hypothetical protein